ncbi:MAG: hypothetical protein FH751_03170 [Firmicutes bacterium]|nr:hypothetical protein [Bacillota bacterium]
MDIEVSKSLLVEWLKEIKQCNLINKDFKVSTEMSSYYDSIAEIIYSKIVNEFEELGVTHLKDYNYNKLIEKKETDIVGMEISVDKVENKYFLDCHFNNEKEVTATKVLESMLSSVLIIYSKFGSHKGNIIFATPNLKEVDKVIKGINIIKNIVNDYLPNNGFKLKIFANEKFDKLILQKVIEKNKELSDIEIALESSRLVTVYKNNKQDTIIKTNDNNTRKRRSSISDEIIEKEHKVAYYLSRFEHDLLFPQYNQSQAFDKISNILGIKVNTLKNKRDLFDPFCNKIKPRGRKRRGWWQKDRLSDDMQRIFNRYLHKDEVEIREEIKEILNLKE